MSRALHACHDSRQLAGLHTTWLGLTFAPTTHLSNSTSVMTCSAALLGCSTHVARRVHSSRGKGTKLGQPMACPHWRLGPLTLHQVPMHRKAARLLDQAAVHSVGVVQLALNVGSLLWLPTMVAAGDVDG